MLLFTAGFKESMINFIKECFHNYEFTSFRNGKKH